MIRLTKLWDDGSTSDIWVSVEHILWISSPGKGTIIAFVGGGTTDVTEHPHDIIRLIVSSVPQEAEDDDGEEEYAQ